MGMVVVLMVRVEESWVMDIFEWTWSNERGTSICAILGLGNVNCWLWGKDVCGKPSVGELRSI